MEDDFLKDDLESLLANVPAQHVLMDEFSFIKDNAFLQEAQENGLWSETGDYRHSPITIFVPLTHKHQPACNFKSIWNRHVAPGLIPIKKGEEREFVSLSRLHFMIYASNRDDLESGAASDRGVASDSARDSDLNFQRREEKACILVGGVCLGDVYNLLRRGCLIHTLRGAGLSDLRPSRGETFNIRTFYLKGETIDLRFNSLGLEGEQFGKYSLCLRFSTPNMSEIEREKIFAWKGDNTLSSIAVPDEAGRYLFRFGILENVSGRSIVHQIFPRHIEVVENANGAEHPIIHSINPRDGCKGDELWILGACFAVDGSCKVMIGNQGAIIFHIDESGKFLKCIIPPGKGKLPVWIFNGNVYTRFDYFSYRELV